MTGNADKPQLVTVRARGTWESKVKTALKVRNFPPFYSDEPQALGGDDTGPNPMEYVMAALNGCVSVMIHMIAQEMNFQYEAAEFLADGVLDVRGLMGVPGVQPHFLEVRQTVRIKTNEPRERLEELKQKVESRCPAACLIKAANVPFHSTWEYME
ncbi:MAG TPA: OsmC family protein [Symbiobacteriaceae bacterium]